MLLLLHTFLFGCDREPTEEFIGGGGTIYIQGRAEESTEDEDAANEPSTPAEPTDPPEDTAEDTDDQETPSDTGS